MTAIFNSMNAGIGNLVAEGNRKQIMSVFEELFSVRFLFTCIMCFGVFMLTPLFIILWVGNEYVMDTMTLLLMTDYFVYSIKPYDRGCLYQCLWFVW